MSPARSTSNRSGAVSPLVRRGCVTGTQGSCLSSGRSSETSDHRALRSSRPGITTTSCSSRSSSRRRSSRISGLIVSSTSSRTGFAPRRRRRRTLWIASSRSSASSSSTSRSASRVRRNVWCATSSMPGNSRSRCAAITVSSGTNRSPSGSGTNRGSSGGTFTRANLRTPVIGSRTNAARLRDRFEMYGNGCAGSTDSGVSTGKMRSSNSCPRNARSAGSSASTERTMRIRSFSSAGTSSVGEDVRRRGSTAPARARGSPRAARRASCRRATA